MIILLIKEILESLSLKIGLHFPMRFEHHGSKVNIYFLVFYYYFLLPISRESIVFGSNFRNGDFDGFARFEGT